MLSVSATTRPKSDAEVDGRDYWFLSGQEFRDRISRGQFLEHAKVFGNWYGTPKDKVEQALQAGRTLILEIDVQGAGQVKALYPDAMMIFILPPSERVLAERMDRRGRDDDESAEKRLEGASDEIAAAWQHYKHMVINDDLEQAVNECIQIIQNAESEV
jgi:guanylate kinase